jgi:hypothetical protein
MERIIKEVLSIVAGAAVPTRLLKYAVKSAPPDAGIDTHEFDDMPDSWLPPMWLWLQPVLSRLSDAEVRVEVWLQDHGLMKMPIESKPCEVQQVPVGDRQIHFCVTHQRPAAMCLQ